MAYNPKNCTRILRMNEERVNTVATASVINPMGYLSNAVRFQTTYYDPLGLKLNYVWDRIYWTYDAARGYIASYTPSHGYWREENSGWYLVSRNVGGSLNSSRTEATSWTNAVFTNGYFCPTASPSNPTRVEYEPNKVIATGSGSADGVVTTNKSGPCAWMIYYDSVLSFE